MSRKSKESGSVRASCKSFSNLKVNENRKLDLTLNFIDIEDLEESIDNLEEVPDIQEVYLTGNPLTSWPGYKDYIVARVPQLKRLDGEDVTKSQQLQAKQKLKQLQAELKIAAAENIEKKKNQDPEELKNAYTKESRIEQYLELQAQKEESDRKSKENSMFSEFRDFDEKQKKKEPISVYNP